MKYYQIVIDVKADDSVTRPEITDYLMTSLLPHIENSQLLMPTHIQAGEFDTSQSEIAHSSPSHLH